MGCSPGAADEINEYQSVGRRECVGSGCGGGDQQQDRNRQIDSTIKRVSRPIENALIRRRPGINSTGRRH